jgi:glutaminase
VGVEPLGSAFNSLVQLEYEKGIPLINDGAIVIADMLVTHLKNPRQDFLDFIRLISGSPTVDFNFKVVHSPRKILVSGMPL